MPISFGSLASAATGAVGGSAFPWAAVIGAGAQLGSAMLNDRSVASSNALQLAFAREQMALQKEMAQHGIRWRVEDAKAAGIHPLFALGASSPSYSPAQYFPSVDSGMSQALSNIGQDISRSIDATRTHGERVNARLEALALRRAELENELLVARIGQINSAQLPPPMPDGVPEVLAGRVDVQPAPSSATNPGLPSQEAFQIPDWGYSRTPTGLKIVPSRDVRERIEDNLSQELLWELRNGIVPFFHPERHAPNPYIYDPGPGREWKWDNLAMEYRSVPKGTLNAAQRAHKWIRGLFD